MSWATAMARNEIRIAIKEKQYLRLPKLVIFYCYVKSYDIFHYFQNKYTKHVINPIKKRKADKFLKKQGWFDIVHGEKRKNK